MRITAKLAASTLFTAAMLVPLGGTAVAAPASPTSTAPAAPSALTLTIAKGDNAATTAPERAVTLSCTPEAQGTHPYAETACAELAAAEGKFDALPHRGERMCTMHYDPVVVTAEGVWKGKRVSYEHTYGNACMKSSEGRAVFAF
ncbi:subtilase-type protease inhibitor [Streptomyces sp. JJ66]|uniref:subtilase-type protease inhibitor n=1 Tax=Streptomyces sp. JJ66 TaxID=2803843 RepID=UPI001C58B4D9|nr:subtilase-type protease inhibitor [Streptomyces sp. JJ66]MBW1604479.1 subtilase-type protease inhibitor [Streptomyces sp. JJ66]